MEIVVHETLLGDGSAPPEDPELLGRRIDVKIEDVTAKPGLVDHAIRALVGRGTIP